MTWRLVDDYYAVLGVQADADEKEVRRAWRKLAARWHPDRAGVGATALFQQLSAAYTVLSDPIARAAYDRRRSRLAQAAGASDSQRAAAAGSPAPPRPAPAPASPARREPAPAVMLSRLCGHLTSLLACGAARLDDDDKPGFITLVLNQTEAAQGGMARVTLNVDVWCPDCVGNKEHCTAAAAAPCVRCGGRRTREELFSAWLAVRPDARSGEVLTPSAELPGMVEAVRFRIRLQDAK